MIYSDFTLSHLQPIYPSAWHQTQFLGKEVDMVFDENIDDLLNT